MESFFWACSFFDEIELKELLLRRYHSLGFVQNMDVEEFANFIVEADRKEKEERLYVQWCAMLPKLNKYMTFEEFNDVMTGANIDWRPAGEIIREIEDLHGRKGD